MCASESKLERVIGPKSTVVGSGGSKVGLLTLFKERKERSPLEEETKNWRGPESHTASVTVAEFVSICIVASSVSSVRLMREKTATRPVEVNNTSRLEAKTASSGMSIHLAMVSPSERADRGLE